MDTRSRSPASGRLPIGAIWTINRSPRRTTTIRGGRRSSPMTTSATRSRPQAIFGSTMMRTSNRPLEMKSEVRADSHLHPGLIHYPAGGTMLPIATIHEIDRLLKAGQLSQRKIAKRLRVSRGTVQALAAGRRGLFGREPVDALSDSLTPAGPPERCPHCGYLVYLPCLVCRARSYRQNRLPARITRARPGNKSRDVHPPLVKILSTPIPSQRETIGPRHDHSGVARVA
jgi:hypothetical protein